MRTCIIHILKCECAVTFGLEELISSYDVLFLLLSGLSLG